jgi:hypothetical protein
LAENTQETLTHDTHLKWIMGQQGYTTLQGKGASSHGHKQFVEKSYPRMMPFKQSFEILPIFEKNKIMKILIFFNLKCFQKYFLAGPVRFIFCHPRLPNEFQHPKDQLNPFGCQNIYISKYVFKYFIIFNNI